MAHPYKYCCIFLLFLSPFFAVGQTLLGLTAGYMRTDPYGLTESKNKVKGKAGGGYLTGFAYKNRKGKHFNFAAELLFSQKSYRDKNTWGSQVFTLHNNYIEQKRYLALGAYLEYSFPKKKLQVNFGVGPVVGLVIHHSRYGIFTGSAINDPFFMEVFDGPVLMNMKEWDFRIALRPSLEFHLDRDLYLIIENSNSFELTEEKVFDFTLQATIMKKIHPRSLKVE